MTQQMKPVDRIEQIFVGMNIHSFWKAFDVFKFTPQAHTMRREQTMSRVRADIEALGWTEGETKRFGYDAFEFWGINKPGLPDYVAEQFQKAFGEDAGYYTDDWNRGVLPLTKEQAIGFALAIERWNGQWDYPLTEEEVESGNNWNPYQIGFWVATGTEHEIPVNPGTYKATTSWQW